MAFGFNTTAVTFTPAIGELISASFDSEAPIFNVSNAADTTMIFERGQVDYTATAEINGSTTMTPETAAATFSIAWTDGNTDSLTTSGILTKVETRGTLNTGITTTLTFKLSQA